ncbi:MAG: SDR family oxidoreductase [Acidobacteria bacterium]|nr:SDR family oxidoreductase [Acidobacteriota bacterium]
MIDPGLRNRTVLITGANNPFGIGTAAAIAFASVGAKLFLHFFRSPDTPAVTGDGPGESFYRAQQLNTCEQVMARVTATGGEAHSFEADFADSTAVERLFDAVERTFGRVEVLINNAATWAADTFVPPEARTRNPFLELWTNASPFSGQVFTHLMSVNACAPAMLIHEFARRHVAQGARWGRIVNISTDGADCFPSEITYGASKLALESLTRSAAYELGQFGITVNALALGPVQTGWITPELEQALLPRIPLGRLGTAAEVADAIVFFSSEQGGWITGQRVFVGGGHRM